MSLDPLAIPCPERQEIDEEVENRINELISQVPLDRTAPQKKAEDEEKEEELSLISWLALAALECVTLK